MYVYILKLEHGKYYVGRTNDVQKRVEDHKAGRGSEWTRKYKMLSLIRYEKVDSPFYEDMWVKEMMHKHGINNVRGGSYSQIWLPKNQYMCLQQELNGAMDKCFQCGGDHFAKDCTKYNYSIDIEGYTEEAEYKKSRQVEDEEVEQFIDDIVDLGSRAYASSIRKGKRLYKYLFGN